MTGEISPLHDTALLSYLLTCTPDPLLVSTQATKALGKLTLMIQADEFPPLRDPRLGDSSWSYGPEGTGRGALAAGSARDIWCQKIVIDIPRGEAPADLARIADAQDLNPIVAQLPQWNVSKALAGNFARFTFTPSRGGSVKLSGSEYLTAVIDKIPVNAEPGTATVTIAETTSASSATAGFTDRHANRDAPKVTTDFYFYNLHPRDAAIPRGDAPLLEWKGNTSNTDFTIHWFDGVEYCSEVLQPSAEAWFPRRNIPLNSTTFLVMAEHRPPGQTTPIRRHLTTTVEIIDPNIIAHEITAKGDVTIAAGKRLRTDNIARTGTGDIRIADPVTASGSLTVSGATTLNGATTVSDNATVTGSLTVGGSLAANGDVTVASGRTLRANTIAATSGATIAMADNVSVGSGRDLTVGRNQTVGGNLTVSGNFRADGKSTFTALSAAQWKTGGYARNFTWSWQAPTDGYLSIALKTLHHSEDKNPWRESDMYFRVEVTVGSLNAFASTPVMAWGPTLNQTIMPMWSTSIPVWKGGSIGLRVTSPTAGLTAPSKNAAIDVYWIPLGA